MNCLIIAAIISVIVFVVLIPLAIYDLKANRPYIDDTYLPG
jgi:hypothetical protein